MKKGTTIVDRYIKQVDVYLRVNEKKKNIVACRYISVIIARMRRRVSHARPVAAYANR